MWKKFKILMSQYLEINETRKSIIVLILIAISILGLYKANVGIDIPYNISNVIIALAGMVFGANVSNTVSSLFESYIGNKNIGNVEPMIVRDDMRDDEEIIDESVNGV